MSGAPSYDGDADIVFFDGVSADGARSIVQTSRFSIDGWSAPRPAIPSFGGWHAGAQISPDGRLLYFESTARELSAAASEEGGAREDSDLWVAERTSDGWGKPRPVGSPFDSPYNEHNVTISSRGTICINSRRRGITAGHDILCSLRSGHGWNQPIPLSASVNGPSAEVAPFIDAQERFLLFSSDRPGGMGGFDLYISRNVDGEWRPAVNLGPEINGPGDESGPSMSRDGRRLIFSRKVGDRVIAHEALFSLTPEAQRH